MKESSTTMIKRYIADRYTMAASMEKGFKSILIKESLAKVSFNTARKMVFLGCKKRGKTMKGN